MGAPGGCGGRRLRWLNQAFSVFPLMRSTLASHVCLDHPVQVNCAPPRTCSLLSAEHGAAALFVRLPADQLDRRIAGERGQIAGEHPVAQRLAPLGVTSSSAVVVKFNANLLILAGDDVD